MKLKQLLGGSKRKQKDHELGKKKKRKFENDISQAKETIEAYNKMMTSAMKRALEAKSIETKNAAMKTAQTTKEAMDKVSEELEYLQGKLVRVVSKKPDS